jgi:hypothetical protein
MAVTILNFVLANTKDLDLLVQAHAYLIRIKIENAEEKDFTNINTEIEGLTEYEIIYFLSLQLIQAHFVAFKTREGRAIIKKALDLRLDDYKVAQVKMELADILLFEEKFNQALIYYSQIEMDLKMMWLRMKFKSC